MFCLDVFASALFCVLTVHGARDIQPYHGKRAVPELLCWILFNWGQHKLLGMPGWDILWSQSFFLHILSHWDLLGHQQKFSLPVLRARLLRRCSGKQPVQDLPGRLLLQPHLEFPLHLVQSWNVFRQKQQLCMWYLCSRQVCLFAGQLHLRKLQGWHLFRRLCIHLHQLLCWHVHCQSGGAANMQCLPGGLLFSGNWQCKLHLVRCWDGFLRGILDDNVQCMLARLLCRGTRQHCLLCLSGRGLLLCFCRLRQVHAVPSRIHLRPQHELSVQHMFSWILFKCDGSHLLQELLCLSVCVQPEADHTVQCFFRQDVRAGFRSPVDCDSVQCHQQQCEVQRCHCH